MKKKILGTVFGMLFALVSIVSSQYMSMEDASAKMIGSRYDTGLCYAGGNYGVRCNIPMKMGPCGTQVTCSY